MSESVYSLIPPPSLTSAKPPIHRSKYPSDTPPTASTFGAASTSQSRMTNIAGDYDAAKQSQSHRWRQSGANFGPKNLHYTDPTAWQKSQSLPEMPEPKRFEYHDRRKPAVVKKSDAVASFSETIANRKPKNFITENALAVIMADARKKEGTGVNYLKKDDYGAVPSYLSSVKSEIDAEKAYIREVVQREAEEARKKEPRYGLLPEEEREKLLLLLKKKWEQINAEYQQITHIVALDTIGKVRRKEHYEEELAFIEKSIEKLSKPFVFVRQEADTK